MVKAELNYPSLAHLALSIRVCEEQGDCTLKLINFSSLFLKTVVQLLLPQSAITGGFTGP